jgi:cellulose synthase/poly-beta-1,6-N-acetylglucosamine synthase-like glycosyltransferase
MSTLSIGVAIPCYKGHISVLKIVLDSIEQQTRKPDKVVVSCSSSDISDIPPTYYQYSFPLVIATCLDKKNAAQNRNNAVRYLDTDIITFMDADDHMHPQRLEVIEQCFQTYPVSILYHFYETNIQNNFIKYSSPFPFELNKLYVCPWRSVQHINYPRGNIIHNSQMSVRKEICNKICFREEQTFVGREDSWFGADILLAFSSQNAYCPLPLSKYTPSRSFETQVKDL